MKLRYAIQYVDEMERAVAFYRDTVGLTLRFQSPYWTEFDTGGTTLALHPSSDAHPAGAVQLGFGPADVEAFYAEMVAKGVSFTMKPTAQRGATIARFLNSEGAECSVGG